MDDRPLPPDPNALTQPLRITRPASAPLPPLESPLPLSPPAPSQTVVATPYVHRFGSLPLYLFARFAAFGLDIFGVGFVLATFGFNAFEAGYLLGAGRDERSFDTLVLASLGTALLFALFCEGVFGTTLGKLLFALHVRRANGKHAGGLRVLTRALLRPVDVLLVGPLLALVTPRHQRIGDLLAGTVVSRSRIGAFASLLALVLVVLLGYAQIVLGGGLTSAISVAAETADFAPAWYARAAHALGITTSLLPQRQPLVQPTAAPSPQITT